jgi:hypothetical protein
MMGQFDDTSQREQHKASDTAPSSGMNKKKCKRSGRSSWFLARFRKEACAKDQEERQRIQSHRSVSKLTKACKRDRSLKEIKSIVDKFPDAVKVADLQGHTALHVSADNATSPAVLLYLLQLFPEACSLADDQGKMPLHYVAVPSKWSTRRDFASFILESDDEGGMEDNMIHPQYVDLLQAFVQAYPGALAHDDSRGRNPIECALLDNAPLDVVTIMQGHSVDHWRMMASNKKCLAPPVVRSAVSAHLLSPKHIGCKHRELKPRQVAGKSA